MTVLTFMVIAQTIAEILRFNRFKNDDYPPSWILKIHNF